MQAAVLPAAVEDLRVECQRLRIFQLLLVHLPLPGIMLLMELVVAVYLEMAALVQLRVQRRWRPAATAPAAAVETQLTHQVRELPAWY